MFKRIALLTIVVMMLAMAIVPAAFAGTPVGVRQVAAVSADAGNYEIYPVPQGADVTVKPAPGPNQVAFGGSGIIPGGTSLFKYVQMRDAKNLLPQVKVYGRDVNGVWSQTQVAAASLYRQYGVGFEGGKTTWQAMFNRADLAKYVAGAKLSVSWGVGANKLTQEWDFNGESKGDITLIYIGLP